MSQADDITGGRQSPPSGDRRARQREHTRRRILDAALELFSARGYAGTSMDDIADRADVARRTLFNHFPAKKAILTAWREDRADQLAAALSDAAGEGGDPHVPARAVLHRLFAELTHLSEADIPLTIAMVQGRMTEMGNMSELFPTFEPLHAAVRAGQDRAEFRAALPARMVAEVLSSCYTDTVTRWALPQIAEQPAPFALGPELSAKLELVLGGLAVPGAVDGT